MPRRVPTAALLLLVLLALPAVTLAAAPSLTATVVPGHEIDLVGAGFPASSTVTLAITRTGSCAITPCDPHAGSGTRTVTSDASGGFTATIDAGPGRGGQYVIVATAGSAKATAEVVAVETAGGVAPGATPTPPATDTAVGSTASGSGPLAPLGLVLVFGLGAFSLAFIWRKASRAGAR